MDTLSSTSPAPVAGPALPGSVTRELQSLKQRERTFRSSGRLLLLGGMALLLVAAALSALHGHLLPATLITEPALPSSLLEPAKAAASPAQREFQTGPEVVLQALSGGFGKVIAVMVFVGSTALAIARASIPIAVSGMLIAAMPSIFSALLWQMEGANTAHVEAPQAISFQWKDSVTKGDYEALKLRLVQTSDPRERALVLGQAAVNKVGGKYSDLTPEQRGYAAQAAQFAVDEKAEAGLSMRPATLYALQKAGQVEPLAPLAHSYEANALGRAAVARGVGVVAALAAAAVLCAAGAVGGLGFTLRRRNQRIRMVLQPRAQREELSQSDDFVKAHKPEFDDMSPAVTR